MKKLKREELLAPAVKTEKTQQQGKQQKEALPEKKSAKKSKLKV
ncbi:hypothetical protein [Mucilaginibacter terrae]|uniref:Uncharacterized protein n=1 Tax=Mucilaginibacter terrae TaxID=1955052 RepID=A0ABU3GZ67_9SPHI|nr:hypothetical protein [Mucilaginibacter terrae]MDT3404272.1 hypothetical protein [Mucilaginibacter terrae]